MFPSGRNGRLQGCDRPLVTPETLILWCSAVSRMNGPSPNGGTGTPIGCFCCFCCFCCWLGCWAVATAITKIVKAAASKLAKERLKNVCCITDNLLAG